MTVIDIHCHTAGIGAGNSGCFISAAMQQSWKTRFYFRAFGVTEAELHAQGDELVLERLSARLRESSHVDKAVVLALDGVMDSRGALDRERTEFYVPNDFLAAQCRHTLAVRHSYNEPRCREAIAFFKAVLARSPNHPQKEQMAAWQNELTALLLEQNYQQAVFYDTRQRNQEAAKAAYRRFLTEFADSKYGPEVRNRLAELEKGAPPARK